MGDGSYETKSCDDGRIVYVNHASSNDTWLWMCGPDDGRCPGAFHVGCNVDSGVTTMIPPGVLTITAAFMMILSSQHRRF